MYSAQTERFAPLRALGAALTHLGPAPMGRMNQTALVEGMNDVRTTPIEIKYLADITDLYYLLMYP